MHEMRTFNLPASRSVAVHGRTIAYPTPNSPWSSSVISVGSPVAWISIAGVYAGRLVVEGCCCSLLTIWGEGEIGGIGVECCVSTRSVVFSTPS